MLIEVRMPSQLSFEEYLRVYAREVRSPSEEARAYDRVMDFLFHPDAVLCVWSVDGRYRSALRLEPWRDGFLLNTLATAPEDQGRGYATDLVRAVLEHYSPVYSHISHDNAASIRVHEKCGFQRILEYAVYVDGSVNYRCCTLVHER